MELINKYRPKTWSEVVGHSAQVKAMSAAIKAGRAKTFLLSGPSGVGKTTLARVAAAALGEHEIVEVDAATKTGIDDVRELQEQVRYRPLGGGVRAVIIDEAHALSKNATQALLKTLEEPPSWLYWFLCTTEANRILATIKTRCFVVDLKPVPESKLVDLLDRVVAAEKLGAAEDVVDLCAAAADGSPRAALSNLALCSNVKYIDEAEDLLAGKVVEASAVELARVLVKGGGWKDIVNVLNSLPSDTSAESVRHIVRAYVDRVVRGSGSWKQAERHWVILDVFSQPFASTDRVPALTHACGKVMVR